MSRPLSAAQRRLVEGAEIGSGRLRGGTPAQLAALVKRGLAFRHPRPPHDHFLTPAGHRAREEGAAPEPVQVPDTAGVFAARVGGERSAVGSGPARLREVRGAWQGMLELRRMTNPDGATDRPCGWERSHLVQAAALALEAAGHRPAGEDEDGYRVRETPQPEAVAVYEADVDALRACAATLEGAGWQVGEYTEPRTRARYLLASPRRV
ncbi:MULTISPECIES: hypothetical protein [Streptomyces]|uniref:Uncharacterized protein n=1 Tax=Streptomyces edwardsiae TaxID=3075527 RepID=A0ABU2QM90_9ACTN|nr:MULTISPECIES: hypothetical protein [unclassified Streptomyces]MDT0405579.1 hypothetical protein [Streptomyces sp. DSM 41635]